MKGPQEGFSLILRGYSGTINAIKGGLENTYRGRIILASTDQAFRVGFGGDEYGQKGGEQSNPF